MNILAIFFMHLQCRVEHLRICKLSQDILQVQHLYTHSENSARSAILANLLNVESYKLIYAD